MIEGAVPFASAGAAFWWAMAAAKARAQGSVERAGRALVIRPCEPVDVWMALDRLRAQGRLSDRHVRVLRSCARQFAPPPPYQTNNLDLWHDALGALERELRSRGIIE